MKLFSSDDNAVKIGGKRVPYSLLGAAAAILGAFLIWKFNQAGGISLGQASPDLSALTDSLGGGGAGVDLGAGANDLLGRGTSIPVPVYSLGTPDPIWGQPVYAAAMPMPAIGGVISDVFHTSYWSSPGTLSTVAAFQPIAPQLGGLLPGVLTPAKPAAAPVSVAPYVGGLLPGILSAPTPAPAPYVLPAPTPSASGRSL
jgi:hypothetical protein